MTNCKYFASRYIIDVGIEESFICLGDSTKNKFYIDKNDKTVINEFKNWFANIFVKGISGSLTILEYVKVEHDGQIDLLVKKILTTSVQT